jgi:protoporphyrinogen oxidase
LSMRHTRLLSLNLLWTGPAAPNFRDLHWVYLPEKDLPFYRIGFYSHLPVEFVQPGMTSVYVEAAVAADDLRPPLPDLVERCMSSLEKRGWVERKEILAAAINWIDCAYVHFTPQRRRILPGLLRALADRGVHPIGRYGLWDYLSMEDSILSGVETARRLLKRA